MKILGKLLGLACLWSPLIVVAIVIMHRGGCQRTGTRVDDNQGNPKYRSGPSVEDVVREMQRKHGGPGVSQSIDD